MGASRSTMSRVQSTGVREASHAGTWYTGNPTKLKAELESNLGRVSAISALGYTPPCLDAKAVIAPHAGYTYSGKAAAWAYASIPTKNVKKVFVIGPSHYDHFDGIALSSFASYDTPLGELPICTETVAALRKTGLFSELSPDSDEREHSLEMQMPYLRLIFAGRDDLRLIPLIIAHPSPAQYARYAKILAPYWQAEDTFFVFSTDFCHWGSRFGYTNYYPRAPDPHDPVPPVEDSSPASTSTPELSRKVTAGGVEIWKSIQYMDHEGIEILRTPGAKGKVEEWAGYLRRTGNTICGRYGLTLLLYLVKEVYGEGAEDVKTTFVRYEQNEKCRAPRDSSVSYVSGVVRVSP